MRERVGAHVEVAREDDDVLGPRERRREPRRAQQLGVRQPLVGRVARAVRVREQKVVRPPSSSRTAWTIRRSFAHASRATGAELERARLRVAEAARVQRQHAVLEHAQPRRDDRSRSPGPRTPSEAARGAAPSAHARAGAVIGSGPSTGRAATSPTVKRAERPRRHLLQAEHVRIVGGRERDHLVEERATLRRLACCRGRGSSCGRARDYATSVRVLLADPPAFTPWYDHELAAALARAGADVELATSRFRFGDVPAPDGYRAQPSASTRSRRASSSARALRLPLKAVEHVGVMRVARRGARRTSCTCSGSRCRRPTCTCGSARRRSSPRTTCCRGARPASATSGSGCSSASTASSCTPSAAARRSPSSASTRASSRIPSTRARRRAPTTGARCSRSA